MNGGGKIYLGNGIYIEATGFTDIVIDGVYHSVDGTNLNSQGVDATNLNSQGVELHNKQKYAEAIVKYDAAILVSNKSTYHSNKASAYNQMKNYAEAIKSYEFTKLFKDKISHLLCIGWSFGSLDFLISSVLLKGNTSNNKHHFIESIDVITGFDIPEETKFGSTVKIFNTNNPAEWAKKLHKIGVEIKFISEVIEKDLEAFQNELLNKNTSNQSIKDLIISEELESRFYKVFEIYESKSAILKQIEKPICNWSRIEINNWAEILKNNPNISKDPKYLPEIIAVIKRANLIDAGHELRIAQIISILTILDSNKHGRLAQISTGEGKSTITAAIAIAKALQGNKVDVITSSEVLAKRDAEEKSNLFEMFSLTVGHNSSKDLDDFLEVQDINSNSIKFTKKCYLKDIVYGDAKDFQGDLLRHEYSLKYTRGERGLDVAIVDEVDSMLID